MSNHDRQKNIKKAIEDRPTVANMVPEKPIGDGAVHNNRSCHDDWNVFWSNGNRRGTT